MCDRSALLAESSRWVAWNVDGANLRDTERSDDFRFDPRIPQEVQVGDDLYRDNRIDRGHIARRADLCWGSVAEAEAANSDSFYFTNITPQMDDFNQASRSGVWGRLEDALFAQVEVDRERINVFAGPVLAADDPVYRDVALPREHWKIIYYLTGQELRAQGFLFAQDLTQPEAIDLPDFVTWQVPLRRIAEVTELIFTEVATDIGQDSVRDTGPQVIRDTSEISW